MRAEYCIEPTVDVYIDPASEIPSKVRLDDADVYLEISEDNLLKKVKVAYAELPIKTMQRSGPEGKRTVIIPGYPDINNRAFRVMLFLFNEILVDAGYSALNLAKLKNLEPTISPETSEEEEKWKNCRKIYETACAIEVGSAGMVSFDKLTKQFNHAKAYANYADANNTDDPITKYERLYKVAECFLGDKPGIDQRACDFMIQHDSTFIQSHFEELRTFRNRCTHPHQKHGHITSIDIELMGELFVKTKQLERIAELLLKHNQLFCAAAQG